MFVYSSICCLHHIIAQHILPWLGLFGIINRLSDILSSHEWMMVWFRKLWVSRDERHEREQAGGSAQRLRVRADLRGQGRRLDARRRRAVGVSAASSCIILLPILKTCDMIASSASSLILEFSFHFISGCSSNHASAFGSWKDQKPLASVSRYLWRLLISTTKKIKGSDEIS